MKKKLLAIAVAAAAGAALCGITADAAVYQLDEIIVNGDKYTDDTIMPGARRTAVSTSACMGIWISWTFRPILLLIQKRRLSRTIFLPVRS